MDLSGHKEASVRCGCTLAQPGEYDWSVRVRRWCGLYVNLLSQVVRRMLLSVTWLWWQGTSVAFIGPCLREFQRQTNSSLSHISRLFLGHASGSMVGSVVSIYAVGGSSVVAVSLLVLAVSVAVVPWCRGLMWLVAAFCVQGFTSALTAASTSFTTDSMFTWCYLWWGVCRHKAGSQLLWWCVLSELMSLISTYRPDDATATPSSLASLKSRLVNLGMVEVGTCWSGWSGT